jgi:hypothetical protein
MPRRLPELDADTRKTAAKSAGSRSSTFAGVEWDNNTDGVKNLTGLIESER